MQEEMRLRFISFDNARIQGRRFCSLTKTTLRNCQQNEVWYDNILSAFSFGNLSCRRW